MRVFDEIIGSSADGKQLHKIEAYGNSTETKPSEESVGGPIIDGSICIETDTGKAYLFNEASSDWVEV